MTWNVEMAEADVLHNNCGTQIKRRLSVPCVFFVVHRPHQQRRVTCCCLLSSFFFHSGCSNNAPFLVESLNQSINQSINRQHELFNNKTTPLPIGSLGGNRCSLYYSIMLLCGCVLLSVVASPENLPSWVAKGGPAARQTGDGGRQALYDHV